MTYRVTLVTTDELKKKAFEIREEVFVVEQQVSREEEFDEFEDESYHFVALDENDDPIGSARWRYTEKGIKLERFTAKKEWRGK
ncbi:MAG: GNAT family N-acetyltransferase, partial [Ekhidna sp.]